MRAHGKFQHVSSSDIPKQPMAKSRRLIIKSAYIFALCVRIESCLGL